MVWRYILRREASSPSRRAAPVGFRKRLWHLAYTRRFPSFQSLAIDWTYYIFEALCYMLMPGFTCYGKPLPHIGGQQLKYYCSAYTSFYLTIFVMAALHGTGIFPIYTFLDEFGPIMSVPIIYGFLAGVADICLSSRSWRSALHHWLSNLRRLMGAELNPRLFEFWISRCSTKCAYHGPSCLV